VESDRGLEGGGRAAGNIENAVAQVCEIIGSVCVLVSDRGRLPVSGSIVTSRRSSRPHFLSEMYFGLYCLARKKHIYKTTFGLRPGPRPRWLGAQIRPCLELSLNIGMISHTHILWCCHGFLLLLAHLQPQT
jgi:hypothetical protein